MFFKYLWRHWWRIIFLFAGLTLQVWAALELPTYMAQIVNNGIIGGDKSAIWNNGSVMLIVAGLGGVGMVVAGWFSASIGSRIAREMRNDIFKQVLSFSIGQIDDFHTASLITRTTNDITQIQTVLIMFLRMSCQAPLMAIGAIIQAFRTAPNMTWIMALSVVALLVIITTAMVLVLPKFKAMQKAIDRLNQLARENLTGLRVVRAFNNEKYEEKRFDGANQELARINFFTSVVMGSAIPLVSLVMNLTTLAIVWIGAHQIIESGLEIGNMMAFLQYALQVIFAFMFLAFAFVMVPRGVVSWKRIKEVLVVKPLVVTGRKVVDGGDKVLEFDDISFSYGALDGNKTEGLAVAGVSFDLKRGETLAILGGTGSGKTTLVNLMAGFFSPSRGEISVGGKIGLIPQKNLLFKASVAENLRLGNKEINNEIMEKSLKNAMAWDFLKDKGGLKTEVSQNGANFSGGQKQRLCIARALASNSDILIFDDSFSALDLKTDSLVRGNLAKNYSGVSKVIIAQRISTIKDADKIMVLDGGRVVGFGKHNELLKNNKTYLEIAKSQLSEDEFEAEIRRVK